MIWQVLDPACRELCVCVCVCAHAHTHTYRYCICIWGRRLEKQPRTKSLALGICARLRKVNFTKAMENQRSFKQSGTDVCFRRLPLDV